MSSEALIEGKENADIASDLSELCISMQAGRAFRWEAGHLLVMIGTDSQDGLE